MTLLNDWLTRVRGPRDAARKASTVGPARSGSARADRGRPLDVRRFVAPEADLRDYDRMRATFPLLDVAVTRLVQLCGCPHIEGTGPAVDELRDWLEIVPTGPTQRGLTSWLQSHLDSMLVYGIAVGVMVPDARRRGIAALSQRDVRTLRLEAGDDPLSLRVFEAGPWRALQELPPALTLVSLRAPQSSPYGTSLLRSISFAASACDTIENATAQVWMRMGAPSFHVNWSPSDLQDPKGGIAETVVDELRSSFADMMSARTRGEVKDFFTTGGVSVSVLGSEGQLIAVQESFRVFAEQMVAVTGLPPWLLGLHWSATERLSVQQADLLVANIEAIRRDVHPQLERLVTLRQSLRGVRGTWRLRWPNVNLRDATEQARADAWREQARNRRIENARRMWELGFWSQAQAATNAAGETVEVARAMDAPEGRPAELPAALTPIVE